MFYYALGNDNPLRALVCISKKVLLHQHLQLGLSNEVWVITLPVERTEPRFLEN